jgi:hypothetical protein
MIWATSISILVCWNRSTTRSARGCYLCSRYIVLPMCPGRTVLEMVARDGFVGHYTGLPLPANGILRQESREPLSRRLTNSLAFECLPSRRIQAAGGF